MSFIEFLFIFSIGFFSGITSMLYYGFYLQRKTKLAKEKLLKVIKDEYAKVEAELAPVKERLQQAFDITELQLDMIHKHEGPQSGPLHGKHRNNIHAEVKKLDEEKMRILQSIIADGHDPSIYIINDVGEKEQIKLSKYLEDKDLLAEKSASPVTKEKPARRLSLVKDTPPQE